MAGAPAHRGLAVLQIVSELQEASLNQEQVELLWEVYQEARGQMDSQRKEASEAVHAPGLALGVVGRLLTILHLMYQVGCLHCRQGWQAQQSSDRPGVQSPGPALWGACPPSCMHMYRA